MILFGQDIFQNPFIVGGIYAFITIVIGLIIKFFVDHRLKIWARNTKTQIDDIILKRFSPFTYFVIIIAATKAFSSAFSNISETAQTFLTSLVTVLTMLVAMTIIDAIIEIWQIELSKRFYKVKYIDKDTEKSLKSFGPFLHNTTRIILGIVCLFIILRQWKIDVTPLLGAAGIAGLAISFAARQTLENIISGIGIMSDRRFSLGDMVRIPQTEVDGKIHELGLFSTKIISYENNVYIVPNATLANTIVLNKNLPDEKTKIFVPFSVAYGTDVPKMKKIIFKILSGFKKDLMSSEEPQLVFLKMGDFSLFFELRFVIKTVENRLAILSEMNEQIYTIFKKEGIEIPFPTTTVHLKK